MAGALTVSPILMERVVLLGGAPRRRLAVGDPTTARSQAKTYIVPTMMLRTGG